MDTAAPEGRPAVAAIVGPTASGKSALAAEVADRASAHGIALELLSVDSMAVYRGMDIGTDKPPAAVRARVRYHLLDVADPSDEFTVQRYQAEADRVLTGVSRRGAAALAVGGTGLYLRAVVDPLAFPGRYPAVLAELEHELAVGAVGVPELHARLQTLDPLAASRATPTNRRRVLRALEVTIGSGRPYSSFGPGLDAYPPTPVALFGIPWDPPLGNRRIAARFESLMESGLLEEVRRLAARPAGLSRTARQAAGYRELLAHVEEGRPLGDAVEEAIRRTGTLARRQWAWFRRDPRIVWLDHAGDAAERILDALGASLTESGASPAPARD